MPDDPGLVLRQNLPLLGLVWLFSLVANLLLLTSPLFMLQVYERVLPSQSEPTLVVLLGLVVGVFAVFGLLDFVRGRLAARIGAAITGQLAPGTCRAALTRSSGPCPTKALEDVSGFFNAPVCLALFDLPWTVVFLTALFLFHPDLGWLAVIGALGLLGLMLVSQLAVRGPARATRGTTFGGATWNASGRHRADLIRAHGMTDIFAWQWAEDQIATHHQILGLSDIAQGFVAAGKSIRLMLQSVMLALAAWLVLQNQLGPGAMVASSIILGRMLAPLEQVMSGWPQVLRARQAWYVLTSALEQVPQPQGAAAPLPGGSTLIVKNLSVLSSTGAGALIGNIGFSLPAGQALGVIGQTGSGKSTLLRALAGLEPAQVGHARFGEVSLTGHGRATRPGMIGYLPQIPTFFAGTLAQNIARLDPDATMAEIHAAARLAGLDETITDLPHGYETPFDQQDPQWSGGFLQALALARALFRAPPLCLLDEPTAHMDAEGSAALGAAIRELKSSGVSFVVGSNRPAAISECDLVLCLQNGRVAAFGTPDHVLAAVTEEPALSWRQPLQAVR